MELIIAIILFLIGWVIYGIPAALILGGGGFLLGKSLSKTDIVFNGGGWNAKQQ